MKILVCGKGGCGKSVVTALLSKDLIRRGYGVIVADNDESNFGLHTYLGLELPEELMNYFGGKKNLFENINEIKEGFRIRDLPSRFLSKADGLNLIAMGKIGEYGEGCACPINALSGKFFDKLRLEKDEFLVVDSEAGIEHFGRKVERGCDVILMVLDPTRESLRLSEKVYNFGEDLEKTVYFVLNKVDKESEEFLRDSLEDKDVLASIPNDDRIFKAGMRGEELEFEYDELEEIVDQLVSFENEL